MQILLCLACLTESECARDRSGLSRRIPGFRDQARRQRIFLGQQPNSRRPFSPSVFVETGLPLGTYFVRIGAGGPTRFTITPLATTKIASDILDGEHMTMTRIAGESRRRLSSRQRVMVFLLITGMVAEFGIHTRCSKAFYDLNVKRLQLIAVMAVGAEVEFLPGNPAAAAQVAGSSVQHNGITRNEIILIHTSSDGRVLTITLHRRFPKYVALFFVGLPSRDITVTARAEVGAPVSKVLHA
jgi:hypothetical protein